MRQTSLKVSIAIILAVDGVFSRLPGGHFQEAPISYGSNVLPVANVVVRKCHRSPEQPQRAMY